jgi:hypothetical protein
MIKVGRFKFGLPKEGVSKKSRTAPKNKSIIFDLITLYETAVLIYPS